MKKSISMMVSIMIVSMLVIGCASQETVPIVQPTPASVVQNQPPIEEASAGQPSAATKEIHIDAHNWAFTQDQTPLQKGDHVKLIISSSEGTHGIMIPGLGLSTGKIGPGQEEVLEFEATESGTFEYFCNVPCGSGHRGMKGALVIEP